MTYTINTSYTSPNFNQRPVGVSPSGLVLHSTEGQWPSDIDWLCNPQDSGKYQPVSCHYVISPTGEIYRIVDENKRAWHAGTGSYLGITDWNSISVGIEVSRKHGDPWAPAQRDALRVLCLDLIARHDIKQSRIAAHRWIAPLRRSDPTDWSDAALMAWITDLYAEPDWPTLWGTAIPYSPEFGIATAWRDSYRRGRPLGEAVTGELAITDYTLQAFQDGYILWSPAHGAEVLLWRD